MISPGLVAKGSPYFRALELINEDPLEADALFASVVRDTGDAKIRRAAIHQLFYLRLKYRRIPEAHTLVATKAMHEKYVGAIAADLKITELQAERLVSRLKAACGKAYDLKKFSSYLNEKAAAAGAAGVPIYDFSYRVLSKCRPQEAEEILPVPDKTADFDKRSFALALFGVREAITSGKQDDIPLRLKDLELRGAALLEKNPTLRGQLLVIKSRLALKNADFSQVREICGQINEDEALRKFRGQCRYLNAFALLKEGEAGKAYALIGQQKVKQVEIDNRLLKLIAGVSAAQLPRKRLASYMRRASYWLCAPMLRELAAETIK